LLFARQGFDAVGFDFAATALAQAQHLGPIRKVSRRLIDSYVDVKLVSWETVISPGD
jgi:hypothetical protein